MMIIIIIISLCIIIIIIKLLSTFISYILYIPSPTILPRCSKNSILHGIHVLEHFANFGGHFDERHRSVAEVLRIDRQRDES